MLKMKGSLIAEGKQSLSGYAGSVLKLTQSHVKQFIHSAWVLG
jgi:hypothetical protein